MRQDSAPWLADPRDESATLTQEQGYLSTTEATTHGSSVRDEKVTDDQDETRSHPGIVARECVREGGCRCRAVNEKNSRS